MASIPPLSPDRRRRLEILLAWEVVQGIRGEGVPIKTRAQCLAAIEMIATHVEAAAKVEIAEIRAEQAMGARQEPLALFAQVEVA